MTDVVKLMTAKQTAAVAGVSRGKLDAWLSERSIIPYGVADDPVGDLYDAEVVQKLIDGGRSRKQAAPIRYLTAKQAAAVIGIARPNLDKWLARRGVTEDAIADHPVGRLYKRASIEKARDRWLSERDRGSDEKRRASAVARS